MAGFRANKLDQWIGITRLFGTFLVAMPSGSRHGDDVGRAHFLARRSVEQGVAIRRGWTLVDQPALASTLSSGESRYTPDMVSTQQR